MEGHSHKSYGPTNFSQSASAHLGDTYHNRNVYFTIYVADPSQIHAAVSGCMTRASEVQADSPVVTKDIFSPQSNSQPVEIYTSSPEAGGGEGIGALNQDTLIATKATTAMLERVKSLASQASEDSWRPSFLDSLLDWYGYARSKTFASAEMAFDTADDSSSLCAAVLYSQAPEPRLIYLPDQSLHLNREAEFAHMIETLQHQALGYLVSRNIDVRLLIPELQPATAISVAQQEIKSITTLASLLLKAAEVSSGLLLVIEGLESMAFPESKVTRLCEVFLSRFREIVSSSRSRKIRLASIDRGQGCLLRPRDGDVEFTSCSD